MFITSTQYAPMQLKKEELKVIMCTQHKQTQQSKKSCPINMK